MLEYKGIAWYVYQGALLPRVKPHESVRLSKEDQKYLLQKSHAYFLRWIEEWDREESSFWYVIKDEKEDLQNYKSKVRNQIKKGLKQCEVKRVDQSEIAKEGYRIYLNAFKGYDTTLSPLSKEQFSRMVLDSTDEFWGVYDKKDHLIAYANNIIQEDVCHYNSMKFDPEYLSLYPSYALIFTMNRHYLNERGFCYVNDGARSIAHQTNIQHFLIQKFHFRKAYCRLHIAYRRDIGVVVGVLYPFRKAIAKFFRGKVGRKISILLAHEEIRRSFG